MNRWKSRRNYYVEDFVALSGKLGGKKGDKGGDMRRQSDDKKGG